MSEHISNIAASPAVPTSISASSVKSSKRFGRSPAQSIAPVSHSPTLSKAFSLSKISKNKRKAPTSPSAVSSILSGMYAHPQNRLPGDISPRDPGPSKTPFIYRKVARPPTATSAESSGHELSDATNAAISVRARTLSEDSVFPFIADQSLQTMAVVHVEQPEQLTASTGSSEPAPSGRLVGRGGMGSRPRKAIAIQNIVIPKLQSLDAVLTADSPHIALRPSGRGGFGSRPKQLAPPPPPPKSPLAENHGPLPLATPTKPAPTFVRPGGRGGIGAHAHADTPPLTLKDILNRTKPKFGKKSRARARTMTTLMHPISSHLSNEITNASTETLSTLHFAGESTSPPPSFFHEPQHSIESASADDLSLTPPSSATASSFDGSLSPETEDDFDSSVYLEDAPPNLSPADRQQRSINKLTRTFGDNPYSQASGALAQMDMPSHGESFPTILIDRDGSTKVKSTKKFRRASLSMSSIFGRPARMGDSEGLDSQSTIDTITDDLHHLGLGDDNMSESWGEVDTRRVSVCGAPESPIVFSLPSPLPLPQTDTKRTSTLSMVVSLDSDPEFSVPSSTLSRSQSYSHSSRRQSTHISHNHSMSTSIADHAFTENTSVASSVNWLIPPSNDDRDFKLLVTSSKYAEKPLQWTGEWNTDMQDVIRALRELR